MSSAADITELLREVRAGNRDCQAKLMSLVYDELHRLAAAHMRRERPDHTLQASALVNEAYLRLLGPNAVDWQNRAHFFATAASTMRRILVDYARSRNARKRDGALKRVELLDNIPAFSDEYSGQMLALDAALEQLAEWDPRQSRVVELRFFGGLTVEEAAEVLGVSDKTVKRDWSMARAWLQNRISARP